jgi:dipeptidyl-peptidase 4
VRSTLVCCVALFGLAPLLAEAAVGPDLAAYRRAESLRGDKVGAQVLNLSLSAVWAPHSDRFWYREQTPLGWRYLAVDPVGREQRPAFDHAGLATAVSKVLAQPVDADHLPLDDLAIEDSAATRISFETHGKRLTCDTRALSCEAAEPPATDRLSVVSPDGTLAVFVRDDNLWLRELKSGAVRPLTRDGAPHFSYGKMPDTGLLSILRQSTGKVFPPWGVTWSPDSTRLVVTRVDERAFPDYHFLQSVPYDGTLRPKLFSLRTPLSAETEKGSSEISIIDVRSGSLLRLNLGPEGLSRSYWWSRDDTHFFAIQGGDYSREVTLFDIDARTGAARSIFKERSPTFLQVSPLEYDEPAIRYLPHSNEFIWFSQRDGWNHLYLLDARTGAIKAELGAGPWSVQNIVHLDESRRLLFFTAVGRERGEDPYLRHLYSVGLDGRNLKLLTPEATDHSFPAPANPALLDALQALGFPNPRIERFAPSGHYFIDAASTVDKPPVFTLRSSDGRMVMALTRTEIAAAVKGGWIAPEPFRARAADGETDLYGLIVKPAGFDPAHTYPIVECIYNGPQVVTTPHDFEGGMTNWMMSCAQSFAQLGFVSLVMDGRGTPLRSKKFQDYIYNNLQEFALEDHVAVLKSLAAARGYMDLSRLGVIGHSFGGYTSMKAILGYPDFYKAAVSSAGPYDIYGMYPLDAFFEPPTFSGSTAAQGARLPTNWGNVDLTLQAGRLKGKLLIAYGDLDENAFPAVTVRMIDALIKANKEFDLLYMPNRSHAFDQEPYFIRRSWDFFVRNLMGVEPPKDYRFGE